MKILVLSDSHGNNLPIERAIDKTQPDVVFFLGDGSYQAEKLLDECGLPYYIVKGNCDIGNFQYSQTVTLRQKTFFLTHGHNYHVKYGTNEVAEAGKRMGADVVLFGHTHVPYEHYSDGLYLLNPGSCACPRETKASCGIIEVSGGSLLTNILYL